MPSVTFRPIDEWVGERTRYPQRSRFDAAYSTTLDLLDRELDKLRATSVVIQLALAEDDIRLDGLPRAQARPAHPGVVLAFGSKYGPLKYATDTFDRWQDNLRAIALGLEALRKVDRYGITKRGEQYTGWKAIGTGSEAMTREQAVEFMEMHGGSYREAAKRLHPDAGGNAHEFAKLTQAKALLGGGS